MLKRENFSSGAKWEDIIGYSRTVKVGNTIEITGTVAVDKEGNNVGVGDPYTQTKFVYQKIEGYLKQAGASMEDVVRIRMFVTDISRWEEYGKAHAEFFRTIKPCLSMIGVSGFIEPDFLVEIETTAILTS